MEETSRYIKNLSPIALLPVSPESPNAIQQHQNEGHGDDDDVDMSSNNEIDPEDESESDAEDLLNKGSRFAGND